MPPLNIGNACLGCVQGKHPGGEILGWQWLIKEQVLFVDLLYLGERKVETRTKVTHENISQSFIMLSFLESFKKILFEQKKLLRIKCL